ncbi:odorant receptor 30a-like [Rhagoletis pomonella]|uniref:odorant receptor 30a-like n=1 Tax=Rhagoletis pomonella TaxID=28610 RepID=UPI0017844490|nr:odorant receptor 30a-like [Rhagoletis pomonella]
MVDLHKSPIYEICYLLQALWMIPVGVCSYNAYVNSFLISMSFGTSMMKDLQQKLENLSEMDDVDALRNIKECIKRHIKIIMFRDDLEELYSAMSLIDVMLYCIVLATMLVYSSMDYDGALVFKGLQLLLVQTSLMYLTFHFSNAFSNESLNIANAAYNTNWMQRSTEFRKCIVLIIARSQRPLQLTAGGLKPLTLEAFVGIMRASYSLFSVLQGTM